MVMVQVADESGSALVKLWGSIATEASAATVEKTVLQLDDLFVDQVARQLVSSDFGRYEKHDP